MKVKKVTCLTFRIKAVQGQSIQSKRNPKIKHEIKLRFVLHIL